MVPYRTRGFSLLEVTFAVALIGTMIVATSAFLQRVPVNGREVRDQDLALKIARNEIEHLRSLGYAGLPASGSFSNSLLSSLPASNASATITDLDAETKKADVNVSWTGTGSASRSVSLSTLITQSCGLQ